MKWFTFKVQPNREDFAARRLVQVFKADPVLGASFAEAFVPTVRIIDARSGKPVEKQTKLFPGYILIKCILTDTDQKLNVPIWEAIMSVPGIQGLVGVRDIRHFDFSSVRLISDADIDSLKSQALDPAKGKYNYEKGQKVKVKEGVFIGSVGLIEEYKPELDVVIVAVQIFGRENRVELKTWCVEPYVEEKKKSVKTS